MRRWILATLLCMSSTAWAAMPELDEKTEGDITIQAPKDWKLLVEPTDASVTMSRDAFTSIVVRWYRNDKDVALDAMLDKVIGAVNDAMPMGSFKERSRTPVLEGKGKVLVADFEMMISYDMRLVCAVVLDEENKRLIAGIMYTNEASLVDLQGPELVVKVASSLTGGGRGPQRDQPEVKAPAAE